MDTYRYAHVGALDTEDAATHTHDGNDAVDDNGSTHCSRVRQRADSIMRRLTMGSAALLSALLVAVAAVVFLTATIVDLRRQGFGHSPWPPADVHLAGDERRGRGRGGG